MSRRLLAIGAHAADFVWRAGGVLALTAQNGGSASVLVALLRRARRVGRALEGARPDRRERQAHPPRGGRARRRRAGRRLPLPRPRRLPARGRRATALGRLADAIREAAPDVIVTHTDRDPFNPDHPVAFAAVERARALAAGAGVRERLRDDPAAAAAAVRAAPARAVQLHADDVRGHHAGDRAQARRDGRDEGAELPADLLRPARRAARQPRAPGLRQQGDPLRRGVHARAAAGADASCERRASSPSWASPRSTRPPAARA